MKRSEIIMLLNKTVALYHTLRDNDAFDRYDDEKEAIGMLARIDAGEKIEGE